MTTNIELDIENITGVADADDQFIKTAQKFVVSSIPKDLLLWAGTSTAVATHGGDSSSTAITLPQPTDGIIDVQRNGFSASIVPESMQGFIANSSSLYKATETFPKYYMQAGNKIIVKPDPSDSETALVNYVDFLKIDDDCDLRSAVIFHASASEFTKLATSKVTDWTDLSLPVPPISPDFGSDLTISSTIPVSPSLTATTVSFSQTAPSYIKPDLSIPTFPSITWSFPSVPIAPSISSQSVADFSSAEPTFTPPVMSALDFADTENWITTEEDSEMLQSRVAEIQSKIGEYSARMQESQAAFNKENSIYQATVQEKIQEAQLADSNEAKKLQKFQTEISNYQAEVNKVIAGNQGEIGEWQQRSTTEIQKYNTDIQNNLNNFNKENIEYQAQLQIAVQDAQLETQDDAQLLQKYGSELQSYQADVNTEVQDFTNTLQKEIQEYQNKIALYNSELQKFQAETSEKTQKVNISLQNAAHYSKESDKYYNWAQLEVRNYIQNNSKMIGQTIAAQTAASQQNRR